jgi:hypothetical protein
MDSDVTRRTVLKWMGGIAAGLVLSPAPYALVDDLTIATQTRGRSVALPTGPRGRVRTRCSACPYGCSLELHTVGGRPYLAVPAAGNTLPCALRPAVHHLAAAPDRLGEATIAGRTVESLEGLDTAAAWLDDAVGRRATVGLIDLSGRPPVATPLAALAAQVRGAVWIGTRSHWLDDLAARLGLDGDVELSIDPARADDAVFLRPGRSTGAARAAERGDDPRSIARRLRRDGSSGVLIGDDGVGARPDDAVLATVAEVDVHLDAIGPGRLIVPRRPVPGPKGVRTATLDEVGDASLDLLVVDASRVCGSVPWRRIRRKLRGDGGRAIVFATAPGPAMRHGDLVLPASAPLEIEEAVGGRRVGHSARIALSTPVLDRPAGCVDVADLTQCFDPDAPRGAEAVATALVAAGRGRLRAPDGGTRAVDGAGVTTVAGALRRGAVWEGETVGARPLRHPVRATAATDGRPRLVLEGAVVAAAGERVPDLLSKVVREQALLACEGRARAHPDDLVAWGVRDGVRCHVRTAAGDLHVVLSADASVVRGHVIAGCGFGREAFGDPQPRPSSTALESLDLDPRSEAPPVIHAVEVS